MVATPPPAGTAAPEAPALRMRELTIEAQMTFHAIWAAAEMGVADSLANGPRDAEDLARHLGVHGPSLYRLLRALTVPGLVVEDANHRFALTPLGESIRSDVPRSMRAYVRFVGSPWRMASWQELGFSVRTGKPAVPAVFGTPLFEYLGTHPEDAAVFNAAMTSITAMTEEAIVSACDFSGVRTVVDVGGGHGRLLSAILKRNPALRGVLVDLPAVAEGAKAFLAERGLSDRVEVSAGDFFESVPAGGDAYMMKLVIHDWDDERCIRLLRNCRRAMTPEGRLLVLDGVVPPPGEPAFDKLLDLEMLVLPGGQERTAEEFRTLFERAGFRLTRIVRTESNMKIIEGEPT